MELKKVRKLLENLLVEEYNVKIKFEDKLDMLRANCDITIKNFDDIILLDILVFKSGSVSIDFIFDRIDKNTDVYELINQFNNRVVWLKAKINENGYLILSHNVIDAVNEHNVIKIVEFILVELVSDKHNSLLESFTQLTYTK